MQCGAGWQARGKGPICCMRLFQSRYSTGCHLFGETQGRRDYGEEGTYMWEWGIEVNFSTTCVLALSCNHVYVFNVILYVWLYTCQPINVFIVSIKTLSKEKRQPPLIYCVIFHIFLISFSTLLSYLFFNNLDLFYF